MHRRGYAGIGLERPKDPLNIGSVLRAAGCFEAALVATAGGRYGDYREQPTDTSKVSRHLPLLEVETLPDALPHDCVPVAVELTPDADPLPGYTHPERAFYLFGPEDGSLSEETIAWCRDVVCIPSNGCLNLAASVHVVLYDRLSKRLAS